MNVPLELIFVAAWAGIPLWLIARHRHWGPDPASPHGNPELDAVLVTVQEAAPVGDEQSQAGADGQLVASLERGSIEGRTLAAGTALGD
jgi:hypothetical protein